MPGSLQTALLTVSRLFVTSRQQEVGGVTLGKLA
jgi:hypothetical protein